MSVIGLKRLFYLGSFLFEVECLHPKDTTLEKERKPNALEFYAKITLKNWNEDKKVSKLSVQVTDLTQ